MGGLRTQWDGTDTLVAVVLAVFTVIGIGAGFPSFMWWTDGVACGMVWARWLLTRPDQ